MFEDKTFLMTGGTSALGEAIIYVLLENNARVLFTYHKDAAKAHELQKDGAEPIPCDFSEKINRHLLVQALKKKLTSLNGIINNTGIVRDRTIVNMTEEEWDLVMEVNFKAPYELSVGLAPLLEKSALASEYPSKIINIISRVGQQGAIGEANYAASKDALIELTKAHALEFAPHAIHVNAVNPGFMISKMTQDLPDHILERNREQSYLNTFSNPEEVAMFIGYLLSDASVNITGKIFHYDSRET